MFSSAGQLSPLLETERRAEIQLVGLQPEPVSSRSLTWRLASFPAFRPILLLLLLLHLLLLLLPLHFALLAVHLALLAGRRFTGLLLLLLHLLLLLLLLLPHLILHPPGFTLLHVLLLANRAILDFLLATQRLLGTSLLFDSLAG